MYQRQRLDYLPDTQAREHPLYSTWRMEILETALGTKPGDGTQPASVDAVREQNKYNNRIMSEVDNRFSDLPQESRHFIAEMVKRQIARESHFSPEDHNIMHVTTVALGELKRLELVREKEAIPDNPEHSIHLGLLYLRYLWDLTDSGASVENRLKTAMGAYNLGPHKIRGARWLSLDSNWDSIRQCLAPDVIGEENGKAKVIVRGQQSAENYVNDIFADWQRSPVRDHPAVTATPGPTWRPDPHVCPTPTPTPTPTRTRTRTPTPRTTPRPATK